MIRASQQQRQVREAALHPCTVHPSEPSSLNVHPRGRAVPDPQPERQHVGLRVRASHGFQGSARFGGAGALVRAARIRQPRAQFDRVRQRQIREKKHVARPAVVLA